MNVIELKSYINNKDYDSGIVSYNDGEIVGGYNISECYGIWSFYLIDDKGNLSDKKNFSREEDLCVYVKDFVEKEHKKMLAAIEKQKLNKKTPLETSSVIYL